MWRVCWVFWAAGWLGPPGPGMSVSAASLKVVILAGQSNMEGQAEVDMKYGKACPQQLAGHPPVCCSAENVTGCCPDTHSHGTSYPCRPYNSSASSRANMDPCPHDPIQGPTNDVCFINGTLVYQLKDPRTALEFAKCFDATAGFNASTGVPNSWTVLDRVKIWQNEGVGELNHEATPATSVCPKGYCPWQVDPVPSPRSPPALLLLNCHQRFHLVEVGACRTVPDPQNKSRQIEQPCSPTLPLGGCGAWGNM